MKVRIISALMGMIILLFVLTYFNTVILNISVCLICLMAMYEFLKASGNIKNKALAILSLIPSFVIPFTSYTTFKNYFIEGIIIYTIIMFAILLPTHNKTNTESMALTLLMSVSLPFSLSTSIFVRDSSGAFYGIYYILLVLFGAWISDTGAYFSGYLFGNKKLAPQISPKKTVEGAIGGVITCIVAYLIMGVLFTYIGGRININANVNFIFLLFIAPVISILSMIGDLSASIIKRQHNIKDFGSIMPGHGGVLDRFDSVFYVAPFIFVVNSIYPFMTIR